MTEPGVQERFDGLQSPQPHVPPGVAGVQRARWVGGEGEHGRRPRVHVDGEDGTSRAVHVVVIAVGRGQTVTTALSGSGGSGARAAIWRELKPPQEMPNMRTLPLHQGWAASQLTTSTPSAGSVAGCSSVGVPPLSPWPRMSTRTEA